MPASRAATAICSAPFEWPSSPGLATSSRGGPPAIAFDPLGHGSQHRRRAGMADGGADAGRRAVLAEHLAQTSGPLAGGAAGVGQRDRGRHDVRRSTRRPGAARRARASTASASRLDRQACTSAISSASTVRVDLQDRLLAAERRRRGLGEAVDADDDLLARSRCGACARRSDRTRRPFSSSIASNAPPSASTSSSSAVRRVDQLRRLRLDHLRAVEDVVVLEQVGLEREHLLHPQRPLLVPRRGRPSASFHAGSWIDRARARFDSVTPSISSTMRCTLFSGWASVSPRQFTCTP